MITLAHQEHPDLSIGSLCELLDLSRSWYYERGGQADPDPEDIALRDEIERIILGSSGYGYRRVTRELARRGWNVNHKRVLRIMQEESLLCQIKKRFVITTTNSRHGFPVYPNVLADITLLAPDQAWVGRLYVYPFAKRFCVSRLHSGRVFAPLCGLASFQRDEYPDDQPGVATGHCGAAAAPRIDPSF